MLIFDNPEQARIATAAGFGSFIALLMTKRLGWTHVLVLFIVGQVTAYFFAIPVAGWLGWTMNSYGVIGFTTGAFAMAVWGAIFSLAQKFQTDPQGTLTWAWRLWRGGGSSDESSPPGQRGDG